MKVLFSIHSMRKIVNGLFWIQQYRVIEIEANDLVFLVTFAFAHETPTTANWVTKLGLRYQGCYIFFWLRSPAS